MKQLTVSMIILGLIAGLGFWTNSLLQKSAQHLVIHIDEITTQIKNEDWIEALEHTEALETAWNNQVGWWPIILDHQEIDNIEFSLAKVRAYVDNQDKPLSLAQLSELRLMIEHIPAKEAVTLKNIL